MSIIEEKEKELEEGKISIEEFNKFIDDYNEQPENFKKIKVNSINNYFLKFYNFLFKKSNFSKVKSELENTIISGNTLKPQSMLLSTAKKEDFPLFKSGRRDLEIKLLVMQKVDIISAISSLDRFKKARDICRKHDMEKAAIFLQEYVKLYEYYIKEYDKLGGPSSW